MDGIKLRTFRYTSLPFVSKVSVLFASDLKTVHAKYISLEVRGTGLTTVTDVITIHYKSVEYDSQEVACESVSRLP